jgi:deoxyribodipyrimidine photolyase
VRQGEPREELSTLLTESGANAIFAEEDFSPYVRRRDRRVAESLLLHLIASLTVPPQARKQALDAYAQAKEKRPVTL